MAAPKQSKPNSLIIKTQDSDYDHDGVYNFKKSKDYYNSKSGKGFWTVRHNSTDESGTRFDGTLGDCDAP